MLRQLLCNNVYVHCSMKTVQLSKGMQKITHKLEINSRLFNSLTYEVTVYFCDVIEQFLVQQVLY